MCLTGCSQVALCLPAHAASLGSKRQHVARLRDDFAGRLARAMPSAHLDARDQRVSLGRVGHTCGHGSRGVSCTLATKKKHIHTWWDENKLTRQVVLQCGNQLMAVERHYSVVMISCGQQQSRVLPAVRWRRHVVQRRVPQEAGKVFGVVRRPVVGRPRVAFDSCFKKRGMLGEGKGGCVTGQREAFLEQRTVRPAGELMSHAYNSLYK